MEDIRGRVLLVLKYMMLYREIAGDIMRLNDEIDYVRANKVLQLKKIPRSNKWLLRFIDTDNKLRDLPDWFMFYYGLDPDDYYVLYSIEVYYEHITLEFRGRHGREVKRNVFVEWVRPEDLLFLVVLEDNEWEQILDVAKRYGAELYDNVKIIRDIVSVLRDVVYEPEADVNAREYNVEDVTLDERLVDAVIEKFLGAPSSAIHETVRIFDAPYSIERADICIKAKLLMYEETVLPEWLVHMFSLPCSALTVYDINVSGYNIYVWSYCNNRSVPYTDYRKFAINGKVKMADLLLLAYILPEGAWRKIIDRLKYHLMLTEVALRKLKKASVAVNMFG
jgi:hypothetical protein